MLVRCLFELGRNLIQDEYFFKENNGILNMNSNNELLSNV